jgi:hypothetical protein
MAGYPVALVLGIPLYFIFKRYRIVRFLAYFAIGLALGLVPYFAAVLPATVIAALAPSGSADRAALYGLPGILMFLPVSALCGALATTSFWLIARPDHVLSRKAQQFAGSSG